MNVSIKNSQFPGHSSHLPMPVIKRLPLYHDYLSHLKKEGRSTVSATAVASRFHFDRVTVRKDLALTGVKGKPKIGFSVSALLENIENYLGWHNPNDIVLVGCGSMGSALLGNRTFEKHGLHIVAAFDNNPLLIGREIHGHRVLDVQKLAELCRRLHVEIGIIAVPAESAQSVADLLVAGGIRGIWNFSTCALSLPREVILQPENLAASLSLLRKRIYMKNLENTRRI